MGLRFLYSVWSVFNLLLLSSYLSAGELQNSIDIAPRSEENFTKEQVAPSENANDDFVLLQNPSYASKQFITHLKYRTNAARIVSLNVFSYGHELYERKEFQYNFVAPLKTETTLTRKVRVSLRDSLIYRDNKALNIITDLHAVYLKVEVSLLPLDSLNFKSEAKVIVSTSNVVVLVPPRQRPDKPGLCFQCFHDYLQKAEDLKINKCPRVRDVVEFVDFPVALTGLDEGFKKKLFPIDWNDKHLNEIQRTGLPRFTISTWMYVTEPCAKDLCGVIQHRSDNFLTPLISLTMTGRFHIQLHFKDGSAQAFMTSGGIHRNSWNMVVFTFHPMLITVTVKHGYNLQYQETFEFNDFPKGPYYFDDSDGYWVVGGASGFYSIKGFIGPTTLYRQRAMTSSEVPIVLKNHAMFKLELEKYFTGCSSVVSGIMMKMEDLLIDKRMNESLSLIADKEGICQAVSKSYFDLYRNTDQLTCDVPFTGETPETDNAIVELLKDDSVNITTLGEQIFEIASSLLHKNIHHGPLVSSLLHVSGCTGNSKALYTAGVMYSTGLGVTQQFEKTWQFLLVAAMLDHPMSQMSLAYRFLIGVDSFPKRCDIAAGYYKMAASTADRAMQVHQRVHTHSEAVRLDDYDEVASHKGPDSDIFHWLVHQALKGIGDAQGILGEMYWFGKKGFERDLDEAVKFYKMSADLGKADGLFNLGISKLKGQGIEKNETEAYELISKAADQDFPPALNALGFIEVNFRSNHSGAFAYFKRAANKGDRDGLNNLGTALANGWGDQGISNKAKAIEYWRQAAGKGHPGACITSAEEMKNGNYIPHDCVSAAVLLRFVAEQNPEIGWLLRKGLQSYNKHNLYQSFVSYMLAGESGMEVPQYNTALLCDENENDFQHTTAIDCAMRYYNNSAALGWVFSMMKVGDSFWYGKNVPQNIKSAARMYAEAASKNDHPHAVYNLAYMVEYNYSLAGIQWTNVDNTSILRGNLTFAAVLYQRCRDSEANNHESYLPCTFGLVRVLVKTFYRNHTLQSQVLATASTMMAVLFSVWLFKVGDRMV